MKAEEIDEINSRSLYEKCKSLFEGDKNGWRYKDFFKDEITGYEHFKYNLKNDKDYNMSSHILGDDDIFDCACEILDKINSVSVLEMAQNMR